MESKHLVDESPLLVVAISIRHFKPKWIHKHVAEEGAN